jgi:hypothetical protein
MNLAKIAEMLRSRNPFSPRVRQFIIHAAIAFVLGLI